jgi:Zn-dependent protease
MNPQLIVTGAIWYIVFLFSTTCHEGAHALVAKMGGDPTAFHGGQVTLNPVPHIRRSPFGLVLAPIVSYILAGWMLGWASAPYDPEWQRRYPRRAAWMALAGPGANFTLLLLAAAAIRAGMAFGVFHAPENAQFTHITEAAAPGIAGFAAMFLSILFLLNLVLATFNLFPVPPLDGGNVVTLLMSERTALSFLEWSRSSGFGLAGIVLAWYVYGKLFSYLYLTALSLLYPGLHYG